ncbi:membrane protein [Streptomyces albospinus]|uniref:Membrane protein n=1 Tax=Streptomyces albospinus TaxID=285515 RepID=A0ABQ2VIJ2_9ACTN|nr:YfhO family protein [Streptomyces albospinus]GGU89112.1 membrane protein [Streptomyces albospinus]
MNPTPSAPQEGVRARKVARVLPIGGSATPAGGALRRAASPGLAALLSMGAYCLALAADGSYPLGARSRAVNDLGNQFVPFHARLWDLMHGTAHGDLFFNWGSGYGVPFLADFFTYLMNPFSWLVGLFPRALVDLPVFLVTLLSIGLGAALMTVLLGRLHPGSGVLRALLAVGYGLCAWVLNDGYADPMWMWGLVSLPLTGIAADWCLRRVRWVAGTLLVAAAWAGNFYTAAMATLATGLVLALRLATARGLPPGGRLRVLGRAASMTGVGVLLAAPVLTVTLKASRAAQPPPEAVYRGRPPLADQLAQLLPGGHGGEPAPNIFIGVLGLLLVAAFPFVRAVPVRTRIGWTVLAAAIGASFVWKPTILLWHGFALPNGSAYRAAFVLSGVLVMIAWLALAHRPRVRELAAGAALVAVLAWWCRGQGAVGPSTWIVVAGGAAVTLGLLTGLARGERGERGEPRGRTALTAALAGTVLLGSAYTAFSVTAVRDKIPFFRPKLTLTAGALATRRGLAARDDWPRSRTDPGPHEFANNDPLLIGGEGGAYYSSYVPAATARALHGLGAGWYIRGRHALSFEDPVGQVLMGISSHLAEPPGGGPRGRYTVRRGRPAPLLTVRRGPLPGSGSGPDTVFARQERALGAAVYEVPRLTPAGGPAPQRAPGGWTLPPVPRPAARGGKAGPEDAGTVFTARCAPGGTAVWYAPWFTGEVSGLGVTTRGDGRWDVTANPVRQLGTVPADGTLSVRFTGHGRQYVPEHALGCVAPDRLAAAVRAARGPVALTAGGHTLAAVLPRGSGGTAVLAVPAVAGWGCSVDGGPVRAPRSFGGLMAVPLGREAARLSCSYVPPGLKQGLAASGAGVLVLIAVAAGAARRTRRRPYTTDSPES